MDDLAKVIGYLVLIAGGIKLTGVAFEWFENYLATMTPEERVQFDAAVKGLGEHFAKILKEHEPRKS